MGLLMRMALGGLWVGTTFSVGACGGGPEASPERGFAAEARDPEAAFAAMEERLLSATNLEMDYDITAEGAVEVDLSGTLRIRPGGITEVAAQGRFAGQEVDLLLRSEGGRFEFGNGPDKSSGATPAHLNEALLIGLTRMGILHNLAMLVGGAPPDGADGGVREWAVVEGLSFEEAGGVDPEGQVVSFSMVVGGIPAGSAALDLDADGSPVLRNQTVQFPDGEMRVVETYTRVVIHP